jgi:hypothetical protein
MVFVGIVLMAVAAVFAGLWGPLRILFFVAGIVVVIAGFLLALGVLKLKIRASGDGGIEVSADMPTGYTKMMTISESLVEGSSPAKQGMMPPKEGMMPPKDGAMPLKGIQEATTGLRDGPAAVESAQDHQKSSAEP